MNPDGTWGQSTTMNAPTQQLFNSTMSGQQNLSGQIGAGLNTSNLPAFGSTDLTSNLGAMPQVGGYNQQVIDSWNALQAPGLQQAADASRQRLAAQGITNGSTISNMNEAGIGANATDASNKAILAGYTQGNTEYNQALAGRAQQYGENLGTSQLQNSERSQALGEDTASYNAALQGSSSLGATRSSLDPNQWMAKTPTSAAYIPQTIYGSAQDTFNANMMNQNSDRAQTQANTGSAVNALRALGGTGGIGGIVSGLGSAATGVGNAWNWASGGVNSWLNAPSYGTDYSNFGSNLAENTGTWNTGSFYGGGSP